MPSRLGRVFLTTGLLLNATAVWADSQWLNDVRISTLSAGMDRVIVDSKEDASDLYVHVSGSQVGEHVGWFRSADNGATWTSVVDSAWTIGDRPIGAAYGFGVLLQVWETGSNLWSKTVDAATGAVVFPSTIFSNESPWVAKEVVVDSNAETIPAGSEHFIACVKLLDPGTNQITLKAYRSNDHGDNWGNIATLDSGPPGDSTYIGDLHLVFPTGGYPSFHVAYEKGGHIWHVRTTDAGVTWQAPTELPAVVSTDTEVSIAAFGVSVLAVGQSSMGEVVYCHSANAGVSWSDTKLLDGPESGPRLPALTSRRGVYHVVYRKTDGHLATRLVGVANPAPGNWTVEAYATLGATDLPAWVCGRSGGDAGVIYVHRDDNGDPYFARRLGSPTTGVPLVSSSARMQLVAYPSPASGPVKLVLHLPEGSSGPAPITTGAVLDVSGRVIAPLTAWRVVGSTTESFRDGKNAQGRWAPPGTYLARIETPQGVRSTRITIVR